MTVVTRGKGWACQRPAGDGDVAIRFLASDATRADRRRLAGTGGLRYVLILRETVPPAKDLHSGSGGPQYVVRVAGRILLSQGYGAYDFAGSQ